MLWLKAFHLIFMVTWFAGLFYLPRLFVYHAQSVDDISNARFKIMERKLYYGIMMPGALLTLFFGSWLVYAYDLAFLQMAWLQIKLVLIFFMIVYHFYLGQLLCDFKKDKNTHGHVFYRWLNEVPVVFLVAIILLATIRP